MLLFSGCRRIVCDLTVVLTVVLSAAVEQIFKLPWDGSVSLSLWSNWVMTHPFAQWLKIFLIHSFCAISNKTLTPCFSLPVGIFSILFVKPVTARLIYSSPLVQSLPLPLSVSCRRDGSLCFFFMLCCGIFFNNETLRKTQEGLCSSSQMVKLPLWPSQCKGWNKQSLIITVIYLTSAGGHQTT